MQGELGKAELGEFLQLPGFGLACVHTVYKYDLTVSPGVRLGEYADDERNHVSEGCCHWFPDLIPVAAPTIHSISQMLYMIHSKALSSSTKFHITSGLHRRVGENKKSQIVELAAFMLQRLRTKKADAAAIPLDNTELNDLEQQSKVIRSVV